MWTRPLLKSNAKLALQGRYWRSFLLCFLLALLGVGNVSTNTITQFRYELEQMRSFNQPPIWTGNNTAQSLFEELYSFLPPALWGGVALIVLVCLALGFCLGCFLLMPLQVGRNRYFMENRQAPSPLHTVLTIFRTPYLNVVKVMALSSLKILLGTFLIIPGFYWSYCYRMVPYLLAENPYLPVGRAMELSRQIMVGEKFNTFVLDLSFFGWHLLCSLTLGLGNFFLEPYIQATYAELYAALRSKALSAGMTDSSELGGFVRHGSEE